MEVPTLDKFPKRVLAKIDIQRAFILSRLIIAAERLQLFRALHDKPMTAEAIGKSLKLHKLYLLPFLNTMVALGLLHKQKDSYWNTQFAEKYFIAERSIYWTRQYSKECVADYETLTVLEQALASGKRHYQIKGRAKPDYLEGMKRDPREAEDFTQMLFHLHQGDAEALAGHLDLSQHRKLLDVAGGSGVMSIALANAKKNPHLRACILDIAPVCRIAAGNVRRAKLSRRIRTQAGDIHRGLPPGYDVIMFCDIGPIAMGLLQQAYEKLPLDGLVVLVDRYVSDDGTSPLDRLAAHFVGSGFGLATRGQMVEALKSCGFRSIKSKKVYQDVWFITGVKPVVSSQLSVASCQ
jgi:predicted nicotinamide N-methyase